MYSRAMKDFVCVDVADASNEALVQQEALDRRLRRP